jgi:hypothetical protein
MQLPVYHDYDPLGNEGERALVTNVYDSEDEDNIYQDVISVMLATDGETYVACSLADWKSAQLTINEAEERNDKYDFSYQSCCFSVKAHPRYIFGNYVYFELEEPPCTEPDYL